MMFKNRLYITIALMIVGAGTMLGFFGSSLLKMIEYAFSNQPTVHVSATMDYSSTSWFVPSIASWQPHRSNAYNGSGYTMDGNNVAVALGSTYSSSPVTYQSSHSKVQVIGGGNMSAGSGQASSSSPNRRGIIYASSAHTWAGAVVPVAGSLAYVESSAGSLPDKSYMNGRRNAPPEEGEGGTNGPNLDVEQPVGEGIVLLLLCCLTYAALVTCRIW